MKKLGSALLLVGLLIGCSNSEVGSPSDNANTTKDQNVMEIEIEIEKAKKENEFLKETIYNASSDIQELDHKSRRIMDLIKEGELEKLEDEFMIDIELSDDNMFIFDGSDDISSFYPDLASLPMRFAYYNPQIDRVGIGYHVYGGEEGKEFKRTVSFEYDVNHNLKFIFAGE